MGAEEREKYRLSLSLHFVKLMENSRRRALLLLLPRCSFFLFTFHSLFNSLFVSIGYGGEASSCGPGTTKWKKAKGEKKVSLPSFLSLSPSLLLPFSFRSTTKKTFQTLKLFPHPQLPSAFGFWKEKPPPISASL